MKQSNRRLHIAAAAAAAVKQDKGKGEDERTEATAGFDTLRVRSRVGGAGHLLEYLRYGGGGHGLTCTYYFLLGMEHEDMACRALTTQTF